MRNINEENKFLASLAVFRELYNAEKDVYGVISIFLTDLIKNNVKYSFSIEEITDKLNSDYEFNIPPAVVSTSLGRLKFLEKKQGNYVVNDFSKINNIDLDEKQNEIISHNNLILSGLCSYIETKKVVELNNREKEKISHTFCCFLLDENNGNEYIEYITAYIVENELDINFRNQLNQIREGVILYSGIKYNNDLNDLGTWKTNLTIFVETEILFYLAGYSGELYQNLVLDFLQYVNEINQKAQKRIIQIKYFTEVKDEIEGFFTKARRLVEGKEKLNPRITAMVSILNGCKNPADILGKKTDFYTLMKSYNIELDSYDRYYLEENHKYNIISKEIVSQISKEINKVETDTLEYLNYLNYISIHRKDQNTNNFENIGSILLSGNSITLKLAWNDLLKDDEIPLATGLTFITSKLWFKLNKGFGKTSLPKSFDVISKAQIILSKELNDSVGEKYTELQNEFKEGKLSEEQVKSRIIDLRNQVRKPEEIRNDTVKDILSAITEDSLGRFIEEQNHFKNKSEQQHRENLRLKEVLKNKDNVESELIKAKEDIVNEKLNLKHNLTLQKVTLDIEAEREYQTFKSILIIFYVLSCLIMIGIINYYDWNTLEKYTYMMGLIPTMLFGLYFIIVEKDINIINAIKNYFTHKKTEYLTQKYSKFGFDLNHYNSLDHEIEEVKEEVFKLKKEKSFEGF
jgi:hypothetical protein